ncbi:MAG: proton-conducting transporter membrane subunit, partial [Thermoplasmatales archaeon]
MILPGNYDYLWSAIVLFIGAFVVLFASLLGERRNILVAIGSIFALSALIITIMQTFNGISISSSSIYLTGFSKLFFIVILVPGILSLIGAAKRPETNKPGLMVFIFLVSMAFMLLAISSYNLIYIFVAFEGVSIPTYVLTAYGKGESELEAATKYFIIGAFSTGLIIFGISMYYISTGSLFLGARPLFDNVFYLALGLLIFGFGFKLAIFPLHGWAIDTYTGTSNPVASFLSTSSKIMTLVVLMNIFFMSPSFFPYLKIIFAIISVLT